MGLQISEKQKAIEEMKQIGKMFILEKPADLLSASPQETFPKKKKIRL